MTENFHRIFFHTCVCSCSCSHVDEPEELKSDRMSLPDEPDELDLTSPIPSSTSQRPCFDDLDVTPEKEGTMSQNSQYVSCNKSS